MKTIWEKYKKIQLLHSNLFINLYKAKNISTGDYVLIKEIQKSKINQSNFLKIIENMKKLKSENIVKFIDFHENKNSYYLIIELCFMSLEEYLEIKKEPLSIEEIRDILLEINKGLKEISDNKLIHQNLKLSNILLSLNKNKINQIDFKISDFGLNKIYEESNSFHKNIGRKSNTISPEILRGEKINTKSDIWSLGVIIYYMLFKEYPFIEEIESNQKFKEIKEKNLYDLIKKMLIINTKERISWEEYFDHSFFNYSSDRINLPSFEIQCEKHSQELISYCSSCKSNICEKCLNNHSGHKVLFFKDIGLTEKEMNEVDDLLKKIDNNIESFIKIKKMIENIKSIDENSSIYENDNDNNYKYYFIDCLKVIKEKMKINEISIPKVFEWELRLLIIIL